MLHSNHERTRRNSTAGAAGAALSRCSSLNTTRSDLSSPRGHNYTVDRGSVQPDAALLAHGHQLGRLLVVHDQQLHARGGAMSKGPGGGGGGRWGARHKGAGGPPTEVIRPQLHALRATWSSFDVKCTKRTRGQVDSQPLGLSLFLCARAGSRGQEHAHPSRALESFMSSCPPATWPPPPPPSSRPSSSCSRTCSSAEGSGRRRTARPRPRRPCRW